MGVSDFCKGIIKAKMYSEWLLKTCFWTLHGERQLSVPKMLSTGFFSPHFSPPSPSLSIISNLRLMVGGEVVKCSIIQATFFLQIILVIKRNPIKQHYIFVMKKTYIMQASSKAPLDAFNNVLIYADDLTSWPFCVA